MNIKYKIKLVILCMGVFFVANTARAQVFEKLQKYIDALNNIKPFATTTTTTRTIPSTRVIISNEIDNDYSDASDSVRGFCFKKTLKLGDTNNDVKELQNFLALDKKIYPEGIVSGYFGKLTEKAVKQFQIKYYREIMEPANIISPTGLVGAFTLKQLNIVAGCNKNTNDIKINTDWINKLKETGTGSTTTTTQSRITTTTQPRTTTTTTNLKSVIGLEDMRGCINNSDCVPVDSGCCSCALGGERVSINAKFMESYHRWYSDYFTKNCIGQVCTAWFRCADTAEPLCKANKCVLGGIDPLKTTTPLPTTTTTTIVRKDGPCYRCSYSHQKCIVTTESCDGGDVYSEAECKTTCVMGKELRSSRSWYTCNPFNGTCIGSLQQGPVFQSSTECKKDCKNNLSKLFNPGSSLPDLAVKIDDTLRDDNRKILTIVGRIKNIGKTRAVCHLFNGQVASFDNCIAACTKSTDRCKSGEWDAGALCCKANYGDSNCLPEWFMHEYNSLDWCDDVYSRTLASGSGLASTNINGKTYLDPGEEFDISFSLSCLASLNDMWLIADPSRFEYLTYAQRSKMDGFPLQENYLDVITGSGNNKTWKYGVIPESNELNNSGHVNVGCGAWLKVNDVTSTY